MTRDQHPDDDLALFRKEIEDTVPIKQDRASPYRNRRSPFPLPRDLESADEPLLPVVEQQLEAGEELWFYRPGVQRRLLWDLRRGRLEVGLELDLHGSTVRHAEGALDAFLKHCQRQGIRCVRIIHGKGRGSDQRQPVLKQKLNFWLRQRVQVLAFCSAPRWDGGSGAAYVLLRNPRKQAVPAP